MATRRVAAAIARRTSRRSGILGALVGLALVLGLALLPPVTRADEPSAGPTLEELGLPRVAGIALGLTHGCLWGEDGSAWCWGSNYDGELGTGAASDTYSNVPVRVEGIPGRVRQMEADETSTCALTDDGGVWCWGQNSNGEVGDGTTEDRYTPTAVIGLETGAVALADSNFTDHRCVVLDDGSAACWGANYSGQLGDGTWDERQGAVRVSVVDEEIVAMAATLQSTCALTAGGAVRCWGRIWSDPTGKTEEGAAPDLAAVTPLGLGADADATDLSIADDIACVVVRGGRVRCWSWGWHADDANAAYPWSPGPVPEAVADLPEGIEAVSVSHFAWSEPTASEELLVTAWACATRGGQAWCWGGNHAGQLGDGSTTDRPAPVEVQTGDIAQLDVEWGSTLALVGDGSLVTWGGEDPTPRSPFGFPVAPIGPVAGFRPPDTLVPTITTHIPTPADVSTDPPVVGANLLLAAIAMIVFTISTELLNRSLGQLDPELAKRFRPIGWIERARARLDAALPGRFAGTGHSRLANGLRLLGIVVFYGIVFALLDPTWNPLSVTGLWLVLIMAAAFGLVGLSGDIAAWAAARRWGVASELALKPGSLMTAVGSTLFSRALVLVPGVMIGSPEVLDIDVERTDRRRLGGLAGVGLGTVLVIGLVAWVASLAATTFQGGGALLDDLVGGLGAFLLLLFAAAVQNGFVQLLSLRESAGLALRRAHRIPWAIALLGVTFLFWHTLVNPRGDLAGAMATTNVQAFLATVGIVFVFAVVVWVTAAVRRRAPAGPAPVEVPIATAEATPIAVTDDAPMRKQLVPLDVAIANLMRNDRARSSPVPDAVPPAASPPASATRQTPASPPAPVASTAEPGSGLSVAPPLDSAPPAAVLPEAAPPSVLAPPPEPAAPVVAFCARCGAHRLGDARFCVECGADLEAFVLPSRHG